MADHGYLRITAFPVEILYFVFQELEQPDLVPVLRVNTHFYDIAIRTLYRVIPEFPNVRRCIACLKALSSTPANAAFVRRLSVDLSARRCVGNLFRLLRDALARLTHLRHLSIELSPHDNQYSLAWVLAAVPTPLRSLGTSIRCDTPLTAVLESQPELTELCLRGFQTKQPFLISPGAMPRLHTFRVVHAGPSIIAAVVKGRPVEGVSLSIFCEDGCEPLDALALSALPLKRLTIMSLDRGLRPDVLIPEIARRLPNLEALHLVVLMTQYDLQMLRDTGPCLSEFSSLRYLTLMVATTEDSSMEDEEKMAESWAKACPTLRTIILPKGKVWFLRDGKWSCCARGDED
ncbi:uncharacterized protein BXZ73DRAFT_43522 [Epithele typhae]|uniref:uncharacterized protein n=1 Tax=Epithele typhae TaxID=378194 RepID=UPI002008141F|nr:uncharacterized protein BXZ73DRAFT_43522 [Epithele typhae]KAH9939660.1 hypothetical protein BXZ73DRAFT_43522 [Epithele typhae]